MQELQARRHLLFADAGGGGMGYEGLGDSIRATIVVDYVVRRSSVGTAAAELAKCQEARLWSMSQDPRAHTTKEGTGPDGERRQRWALQRVHAALPEGGVLLAAPEQWRLRGGERGQGLRRWPAGALQLWRSEPIRRMQTASLRPLVIGWQISDRKTSLEL